MWKLFQAREGPCTEKGGIANRGWVMGKKLTKQRSQDPGGRPFAEHPYEPSTSYPPSLFAREKAVSLGSVMLQ